MLIKQLLDSIHELVNNEELSNKKRKALASKIKRQYNILIQDYRTKGREISIINLRKLLNPLVKNYEKIKNLDSINSAMQVMAENFDTAYTRDENDKKNIDKEKEKIYAYILGNPGTSTEGMESDYIARIIRRKLTEADGINREDIMNVLDMQSKNMYLNLEEYQKLINDSLISYLTYNKNAQTFSNIKIFDIFKKLAASYKVQGNYEKVKETYEQALMIKSLKDTQQYEEIKEDYYKFLEFMEMKSSFNEYHFENFEEFKKFVPTKFVDSRIFVKGIQEKNSNNSKENNSSKCSYIMPTNLRFKGFEYLWDELNKRNNCISKFSVLASEEDKYNGYLIITFENASISIFENFNEVNERTFLVKTEMIDEVKQLTKNDAIKRDGVECVNHVSNFENYKKTLLEKALKLIEEIQPKSEKNKENELFFDKKNNVNSENSFNGNEVDTKNNNPNSKNKDKKIMLDSLEKEKEKALKNKAEMEKLEEELKAIKKRSNEKIIKISNGEDYSHE